MSNWRVCGQPNGSTLSAANYRQDKPVLHFRQRGIMDWIQTHFSLMWPYAHHPASQGNSFPQMGGEVLPKEVVSVTKSWPWRFAVKFKLDLCLYRGWAQSTQSISGCLLGLGGTGALGGKKQQWFSCYRYGVQLRCLQNARMALDTRAHENCTLKFIET